MSRLGALGILLLAHPAWADDLPRLAVVGMHQDVLDDAGQTRAVQGLIDAIGQSGRLEPLGPAQIAAAIAGREEVVLVDGLLGPGRRLLADGRNLYNQAQPEDAIPVLEHAIVTLRLGMAGANSTRDLWEAWVYLGTSLQALDRDDEAQQAFRAAVALNPGRSPNPALFPPAVVEAFTAARDEAAARAVTLEIVAAGGASVFLDGEPRGSGTVSIPGVLPGEHHVLSRGGGAQAYRRVLVPFDDPPPEGPATVRVELTPGAPSLGDPADTSTARSRQVEALYRALGTHASGVDLILLAGVAEDLLHLQLYSPRTEAFSKSMGIPFSGPADDEAVQTVPLLLNLLDDRGGLTSTAPLAAPLDLGTNRELATMLTQPRKPPPVTVPPAQPPVSARRGIKPLPVALGIAGVAAAGTGAALGVRYATRSREPVRDGTIIVGPF